MAQKYIWKERSKQHAVQTDTTSYRASCLDQHPHHHSSGRTSGATAAYMPFFYNCFTFFFFIRSRYATAVQKQRLKEAKLTTSLNESTALTRSSPRSLSWVSLLRSR